MSEVKAVNSNGEAPKKTGTELLESINDALQEYLRLSRCVKVTRKRESEDLKALYTALVAAQGMFSDVKKNGIIGGRNIPYAKIDDLVEASRGALKKNGLVVNWFIQKDEVGLETIIARLYHTASGQFMESELTLLNSAKEQERGSSITYAARYLYAPLIGLVDNSYDDDGEVTKTGAPKQAYR